MYRLVFDALEFRGLDVKQERDIHEKLTRLVKLALHYIFLFVYSAKTSEIFRIERQTRTSEKEKKNKMDRKS